MNSINPIVCKTLLTASLLTSLGAFTSFASDAIVAPYAYPATSGSANWGHTVAGHREFVTIGQKYRVRQSGDITKIRVYAADTSNLSGFYVKIWRKDASGYDLVGTSANLVGGLVNGQMSTIPLNVPLSDVLEGDYYGYRMETSGGYAFHALADTDVKTYLMTDSTPGENDFDWEAQVPSNFVLPIELYMASPKIAFIGDSIIAGHPVHYSFPECLSRTDIASKMVSHFHELSGYSYQNMGIGSQTTANIAARFDSDIVSLNPGMVVMDGGVNDIAIGTISKSDFIQNWESMLASAVNNNIRPIVFLVLPWTDGSTAQMTIRDEWNLALREIAENHNALVVDASAYVGLERASGPAGNLWDIQPQYNADGVHFNSDGHQKLAEAIWDALQNGRQGTVMGIR